MATFLTAISIWTSYKVTCGSQPTGESDTVSLKYEICLTDNLKYEICEHRLTELLNLIA